jgi:hypothetical protein
MSMTRKQMEAVITGGGSVLHQGRIISRVADLPTEAALAQTDAEKADASATLQAQIAALQAQVAQLVGAGGAPTAVPPGDLAADLAAPTEAAPKRRPDGKGGA